MSVMRLNRKLVLEAPERLPDGAGGFVRAWVPLGTLWAQITAGSGSEREAGATQLSRTRLKIFVRAAPYGAPSRPKPEQRFREGIRIFNIVSVAENDADTRFLICHAEEEVAT